MKIRANRRIGVMATLKAEGGSLRYVAEFGLRTCQLCCWSPGIYTPALADSLRREMRETGVRPTSLWAGWTGPAVWDFVEGPATLGLVPARYRRMRVAQLKKAGEFARMAGLPAVVTHLGFIPENPRDGLFGETVRAVREVATYLKRRGLQFWFETGQETPITLKRLIGAVGTGNLGVNLDPANLILYGKASPVDALDVYGGLVRGVHAKDGMYPTDPMKLGHEVRVGTGRVRFAEFVGRLEGLGYRGAYIIEREIEGARQAADIRKTVGLLSGFLSRRSR